MIIKLILKHQGKKKRNTCICLKWSILKSEEADYYSKSNQDMVKKWAIQEKGRCEGGIYQAPREKSTRVDRWDVQLELN